MVLLELGVSLMAMKARQSTFRSNGPELIRVLGNMLKVVETVAKSYTISHWR